MKKFLSKKPVMITFIVLSVLFIAVYIGMLVRPVSYGMAYKYSQSNNGIETTVSYKINSDKTARVVKTTKNKEKVLYENVKDVWIYRDGEDIYEIANKKYVSEIVDGNKVSKAEIDSNNKNYTMSKDAYKKIVNALKDAKEKGDVVYTAALLPYVGNIIFDEIDIYSAEQPALGKDLEFKSTGAVVFTVIGGVVIAGLVTFTTLSIVFKVKSKNKRK